MNIDYFDNKSVCEIEKEKLSHLFFIEILDIQSSCLL